MREYQESISSAVNGLPVYLAQVRVLKANGDPAPLYSDNGVTSLAQPVLTNGLGLFKFFVADGTYTLTTADPDGGNVVTLPNVEIYEDARNVSVPIGEAAVTLPSIGSRAGNLLGFDNTGLPISVPTSNLNAAKTVADNIDAILSVAALTQDGSFAAIYAALDTLATVAADLPNIDQAVAAAIAVTTAIPDIQAAKADALAILATALADALAAISAAFGPGLVIQGEDGLEIDAEQGPALATQTPL